MHMQLPADDLQVPSEGRHIQPLDVCPSSLHLTGDVRHAGLPGNESNICIDKSHETSCSY